MTGDGGDERERKRGIDVFQGGIDAAQARLRLQRRPKRQSLPLGIGFLLSFGSPCGLASQLHFVDLDTALSLSRRNHQWTSCELPEVVGRCWGEEIGLLWTALFLIQRRELLPKARARQAVPSFFADVVLSFVCPT